ncbi:MAG TPA: hypothetical protein VHD88_09455 [Pyrinomonadaceae bacterium]|nr:hypothetical protein [Pyrinomonadaceae bacterium]
MRTSSLLTASIFIALCAIAVAAQQPEQRASLNGAAIAFDGKGAPAIEARLLTTVLNGSQDSPVTNVRLVIKNPTANSYTYVTGLATFYDAAAVRCGEGLFKVDALAPNESAEADTPGLRLRCSPATWRIVATNLLTRANETAKPVEATPTPVEPAVVEKPAPVNFIISIDGEQHPIQINRPVVLKLGTRNRKIVLRNVP